MGELGGCLSRPAEGGFENDSSRGSNQTWILASEDPDRMKLEVGSTANDVTGCRCDGEVETWRPVQVYIRRQSAMQHSRPFGRGPAYLPQDQPSALRPQHQDLSVVATTKRDAADSFGEWDGRLLASSLPAVHVDDSLLRLRSKHMRCAHGQAVGRGGACLEAGPEDRRRLQRLDADADIFERGGCGGVGGRQRRRNEAF